MDSEMQELINEFETVKNNLKSKIESVLVKNLSNVTFEEYYRYITLNSSLNTQKTYASVTDDISGKLQRLDQVKQFLKEAIEDNLNQNLTNVEFKDYPVYIKKEFSIKSLKESTFYQGWQYRVQVLLNGKPAGSGVLVTFVINNEIYDKTTDVNGIASINIDLPAGTYTFQAIARGKTLSETVVVNLASQEKTAGLVLQMVRVSGRSRAWNNLTVSNLEKEDTNNYATCPNLASQSGTYNTPYTINLRDFEFNLPANSVIHGAEHKLTARLSKNAPSNPEFGITILNYNQNHTYTTGSGTLLASKDTSWQYFTIYTENIDNFTASEVNASNFTTRVEWSTNQNYNVGDIYLTYYKLKIYYSPPQNI